jgi:hypothetical protein
MDTMSSRTEPLVAQFVQTHNDLVNMIQQISAEDWRKVPAGEQRSVGVIAYHTAKGYLATLGFAQMLANGQPLPQLAPDMLHQMNAREAVENAAVSKEDVLGMLDANCGAVVTGLNNLTDEQLDASGDFFGRQLTAEGVVAGLVLGHAREHLESIRLVLQG